MGETTKIQWADSTINFWIGCDHATLPDGSPHPGCLHCYAAAAYVSNVLGVRWGSAAEGGTRHVTKNAADNARALARKAAREGARRRVFGGSLCDPLDPDAPPEALAALWQTIRDTAFLCSGESDRVQPCLDPRPGMDGGECAQCGRPAGGLDWLLLTKRPQRWREIHEDVRRHIWLLTSISDQPSAEALVPELLEAEGFALLGLSIEPLVGPIDFSQPDLLLSFGVRLVDGPRWGGSKGVISWVIVGSESGPKARPMETAWARSIVDQCAASTVPCFVKQMATPAGRAAGDPQGGDPQHWPPGAWPREFPEASR